MTVQLRKVVEWLADFPRHSNVKPVKVTLANADYFGVRFTATYEYTPGMRLVIEGTKKIGETYSQTRFYLLGKKPEVIRKRRNFCFPLEGGEWYISGYIDSVPAEYASCHPFGKNFCLDRAEIGQLDQYERKHYLRVAMKVMELTENT